MAGIPDISNIMKQADSFILSAVDKRWHWLVYAGAMILLLFGLIYGAMALFF